MEEEKEESRRVREAKGEEGRYNWGVYKYPLPHPNVSSLSVFGSFLASWRLKEWEYISVTDQHWFIALAVANLNYVGTAWVYIIDLLHQTPTCHEFNTLLPLAKGITFGESSISGKTVYEGGSNYVIIENSESGYKASFQVDICGKVLSGELTVHSNKESLALLYPLEEQRAAYTHKCGGMRAEGSVLWGDEQIPFDSQNSFAAIDWTRSFARRTTIWKWGSVSGMVRITNKENGEDDLDDPILVPFGLNISSDVYEDKENALFLDGEVFMVGEVEFKVPKTTEEMKTKKWKMENKLMSLEFTPIAGRGDNINALVIKEYFVQICGRYCGKIIHPLNPNITLHVLSLAGVAEDHFAYW